MKAPDKIYLQYGYYPAADIEMINSDWTPLPVQDYDNIEYIRKDALLEWARKSKLNTEHTNGIGWDDCLDELINHIESL